MITCKSMRTSAIGALVLLGTSIARGQDTSDTDAKPAPPPAASSSSTTGPALNLVVPHTDHPAATMLIHIHRPRRKWGWLGSNPPALTAKPAPIPLVTQPPLPSLQAPTKVGGYFERWR